MLEETKEIKKPSKEIVNRCRNRLFDVVQILVGDDTKLKQFCNKHNLDLLDNNSIASGRYFYANFISRLKVKYTYEVMGRKLDTLGVSITDNLNLYINPDFFLAQNLASQIEMIIHECEHFLFQHPDRASKISKVNGKLYNVAADAIINQKLKNLHDMGVTVDSINKQLDLNLDKDGTTDEYYLALKKKQEELNKQGKGKSMENLDTIDDHDVWDEMQEVGEKYAKQVLIDNLDKAVKSTGAGNTPHRILKELDKLKKSNTNWKALLRKYMTRLSDFKKEKTRMKRNRRYGTMFQGRRKKPNLNIVACIDASGSVSQNEFVQFWAEMEKMINLIAKLTIVEFDAEVLDVYEYKKGMEVKRNGCGGTLFKSGLDEALKHKPDAVIVFTDGYPCDRQLDKPNFPVLIASTSSDTNPYDWANFIKIDLEE